MALTPKDWIKEIDKQAEKALEIKASRLDLSWGMWSSEMNRYIRPQIEAKGPDSGKFLFVFNYWITMSQCIEMAHKVFHKQKVDNSKFDENVTLIEKMKEAIRNDTWVLS